MTLDKAEWLGDRTARRGALGLLNGGRRGREVAALAVAFLLLLAGVERADAAAEGSIVPDRPFAEVWATKSHDPFFLVAPNEAGEVRFPLGEFGDGAAHFYTMMAGSRPVEFFVIWTADGVIRTAFNACDVCYRAERGYRQDGEFVVCNNCGNRFPVEEIDTTSGGCNPAPLAAHIDGDDVVIASADLAAGLSYFP